MCWSCRKNKATNKVVETKTVVSEGEIVIDYDENGNEIAKWKVVQVGDTKASNS